MSRNVNREPNQRTLKFIAGTAALLAGAYALSRLSIFIGRDFKTPNLTDAQILAMDGHNNFHRKIDNADSFGKGILVLGKPTDAQLKDLKESDNLSAKLLDDSIKNLPSPLNHTH